MEIVGWCTSGEMDVLVPCEFDAQENEVRRVLSIMSTSAANSTATRWNSERLPLRQHYYGTHSGDLLFFRLFSPVDV